MNKRDCQIQGLIECAQTETTIQCSECKEMDGNQGNDDEVAEYFYDEGWRVFGGSVYCKKCIRKRKT